MSSLIQSKSNRTWVYLSVMAGVLIIPMIGNRVSENVNWSLGDFLVLGVLMTITSLGIEIAIRKLANQKARNIAIALIVFTLLLIWAELAVGIFGTPFAGS